MRRSPADLQRGAGATSAVPKLVIALHDREVTPKAQIGRAAATRATTMPSREIRAVASLDASQPAWHSGQQRSKSLRTATIPPRPASPFSKNSRRHPMLQLGGKIGRQARAALLPNRKTHPHQSRVAMVRAGSKCCAIPRPPPLLRKSHRPPWT